MGTTPRSTKTEPRRAGAASTRTVADRQTSPGGTTTAMESVLELQRTAGNRATTALLTQGGGAGTLLPIQRWSLFKSSKKTKTKPSAENLVVSGPRAGRVMGQPRPQAARLLPKYEYIRDQRRVAHFLAWATKQPGGEKMTAELLQVDALLNEINTSNGKLPLERARELVEVLKKSPDPEVQRIVQESVGRYHHIQSIDENFVDEEHYLSRFGGFRQLQGISGKLNYYSLDAYSGFQGGPAYQHALTGAPPPVPSREGRRQLPPVGGEVVPPPVPSRVGRRRLPTVPGGRVPPPVPSRVGRPALPIRDAFGNIVGPPRRKVPIGQRPELRGTERRILEKLGRGERLTPGDIALLSLKLAKTQTSKRSREITTSTEDEYSEMMGKIAGESPEEAERVKKAIKDYTETSDVINKQARGQSDRPEDREKVARIDAMFDAFDSRGFTDKNRITYRLSTYRLGQKVPFGDEIGVGDYVMDRAFLSASENRSLITEGVQNPKPGDRYVKYTIIGAGGANISGGSAYTNAREKEAADFRAQRGGVMDKMRNMLGAPSGQAEILYRRNTVFRVESIKVQGKNYYVVLRAATAEQAEGKLKNPFNGAPA